VAVLILPACCHAVELNRIAFALQTWIQSPCAFELRGDC
jgi:hypothetical protein